MAARLGSPLFRLWRTVAPLLVLAVLLGVAVACAGTEPTATPTATLKPLDPREELQRTVASLTALRSVAFDLEHIAGTTNLLPGVLMTRAYGNAVVPGRFHITVEGELLFPRSYLEIGMIKIGDEAYMTNLTSGDWQEVSPNALPINLADFGVTLAGIVEDVQSPQLLGEEGLDGVDTYHIGGSITSEVLKGLVPTAGTGFPVELEMWIERETGMLRRALITGQVVPTDIVESIRQLRLDRVNEPVAIEPPGL